MKIKHFIAAIITITISLPALAQNKKADSLKLVTVFKELLSICKNVDFADPKVKDSGTFYKAAPYIIYRGDDKQRAWKDFANYNNALEKKGVDEVCYRINNTINQDSSYHIEKYFTEKQSEGVWHVLMITYKKRGVDKKLAFAFLKLKNRFGLGDID